MMPSNACRNPEKIPEKSVDSCPLPCIISVLADTGVDMNHTSMSPAGSALPMLPIRAASHLACPPAAGRAHLFKSCIARVGGVKVGDARKVSPLICASVRRRPLDFDTKAARKGHGLRGRWRLMDQPSMRVVAGNRRPAPLVFSRSEE